MKNHSRFRLSRRALLSLSIAAAFSPAATQAQSSQLDELELEGTVSTTLSEVIVTANKAEQGSAEDGYRVETTKGVGLWGERSLQDTPYSMTVTSQALIENSAAKDMNQIFKMAPTAQESATISSDATDSLVVTLRGFSVSSPVVNGLSSATRTGGTPAMQDLERVEVINGATGFLYGGGRVGGAVNYVSKKPTLDTLRVVSAGSYGGQSRFAHVDLGGQFNETKTFGYRLNAMGQGGETARNNEKKQKTLSLALDWRPTDDFYTDLRVSYKDSTSTGPTIFWNDDIDRGSIRKNRTFTPKWLLQNYTSHKIENSANWTLNPVFTLRSNVMLEEADRTGGDARLVWRNNQIAKGGWFGNYGPRTNRKVGGSVYLDSTFDTLDISHRLTTGYSFAYDKTITRRDNSNSFDINESDDKNPVIVTCGTSLEDIRNCAKPAGWEKLGTGPRTTGDRSQYRNVLIGDDIIINDAWSVLAGGNYVTTISQSYLGKSGSSRYKKSVFTPTLSLTYKPVDKLTAYATYIESLENGRTVPEGYLNEGEILPPYISKQYEVGIKYTFNDCLSINSALFRIEKANNYGKKADLKKAEKATDRLTQDGQQVHQGFELGIAGKLTDNLTIVAGGTLLDLGVTKATDNTQGKKPSDAAAYLAKIFAEYRVPGVAGLFLSGGAYYTGKKYADSENRYVVPAYTLFDLGLRYETKISGAPTTFNLSVQNVADKVYWASSSALGEPRSISFTVKSQF